MGVPGAPLGGGVDSSFNKATLIDDPSTFVGGSVDVSCNKATLSNEASTLVGGEARVSDAGCSSVAALLRLRRGVVMTNLFPTMDLIWASAEILELR